MTQNITHLPPAAANRAERIERAMNEIAELAKIAKQTGISLGTLRSLLSDIGTIANSSLQNETSR